MARFRYRMQNLLDVKERMETQAKNDFALANLRLSEEEEKLKALQNKKNAYEEKLRLLYSENLDLQKINRTLTAIENLKILIRTQRTHVKRAMQNVELCRAKLTEAMQERKTHERLKEKQFDQFLAEEAASERKVIDEFVSYKHKQIQKKN